MAHEIREAVHRHLHTVLFAIPEEQFFPRQLALAVIALAIAPDERGLNRRGQHDGRFVPMLFKRIQQCGGKAEIALHELLVVLRAVHPREVEHEVAVGAISVQLLRRVVDVVAIDVVDVDIWTGSVLAVANIL